MVRHIMISLVRASFLSGHTFPRVRLDCPLYPWEPLTSLRPHLHTGHPAHTQETVFAKTIFTDPLISSSTSLYSAHSCDSCLQGKTLSNIFPLRPNPSISELKENHAPQIADTDKHLSSYPRSGIVSKR